MNLDKDLAHYARATLRAEEERVKTDRRLQAKVVRKQERMARRASVRRFQKKMIKVSNAMIGIGMGAIFLSNAAYRRPNIDIGIEESDR